jgi:PGF-pre-PGF domain-containing protein
MTMGMVVLLITSPFAATGVFASDAINNLPEDETVNVTDDVEVWERAGLPLRTVTTNADTVIPNAQWYVETDDGTKPLNKSTLGVYSANTEITVQFRSSDAVRKLENNNVHLVAARVSSDAEGPANASEALELLNTSDRADVNENVAFSSEAKTTTDSEGHAKLSFTPEQSGRYVLFLAMGDTANAGVSVDSEQNLSVEGHTTIVGVEHALVQGGQSHASLETGDSLPDQGATLGFDVSNTDLAGDNVRHAVLVYDETTGWTYQEFTLSVAGNPSNVSELSNSTSLEHSVEAVGGVARVEDVTLFGQNLNDDMTGTTPSIGTMFELVGDEAELTAAPDNGGRFLNASMTARQGDLDTIEVETLKNWPASERYRWIHVAMDETGAMETDTGTFEFADPDIDVTSANLNTSEITVGDQVNVTATVKNTGEETGKDTVSLYQDDTSVDSRTVTLDADETKTISFVRQPADVGTYDFRVGNAYAGELTVKAKSGGGGPPGGGGGGSGPPPVNTDPTQQSDGSVLVDIRNARAGETVGITIPSEQATRVSGVTFDQVDVELRNDVPHFELTINSHATRPSSVPTDPDGAAVKGYLQVEKNLITDDDISQATFRFRLDANQLSEYSSPENVVVYRYHDGSWQALETTVVGEQNGEYTFEAVTPGFSVFVIGEQQPDISVSNAELSDSTINVGDTVDVTAEVTNDGTGQGTYTAELIVDGDVVETEELTVAAGETETVTFSYTPNAAGEYSAAIGDTSAGTLTVLGEDETTTSDDPDDTTTESDPDDRDGGGMGASAIAITVLILLGGLAGGLYYFRDEVEQYLEPYLGK